MKYLYWLGRVSGKESKVLPATNTRENVAEIPVATTSIGRSRPIPAATPIVFVRGSKMSVVLHQEKADGTMGGAERSNGDRSSLIVGFCSQVARTVRKSRPFCKRFKKSYSNVF